MLTWGRSTCLAAFVVALAPASASAHGPRDDRTPEPAQSKERSVGGELRGVVLPSSFLGASYLCGDLRLRRSISLVGCGTGSGFLTRPESQVGVRSAELAHFRLDWSAVMRRRGRLFFGAGIAEAELTSDRFGLVFAPTPERGDVEAAGAEVAGGFDLMAQAWSTTFFLRTTLGMAWIPGWTALSGRSASVPFALLTMNARF